MKKLIINGTEIEVPEEAEGYYIVKNGGHYWFEEIYNVYKNEFCFNRDIDDYFSGDPQFIVSKPNPLWYKSITLLSELDETTEPKLVEGKRELVEGDLLVHFGNKYLLTKDRLNDQWLAVNMADGRASPINILPVRNRSSWEYIGNVRDEQDVCSNP